MSTESKPFLSSKSIWGSIVSILAIVLPLAGKPELMPVVTSIDQLIAQLAPMIAVGGSLFSIFGRVTAKTQIKGFF